MVITLVGYRGSGKTTVARLLATALNLSWIDSDDVIEERAGRSIREIFAEDGEGEFRRLEQAGAFHHTCDVVMASCAQLASRNFSRGSST